MPQKQRNLSFWFVQTICQNFSNIFKNGFNEPKTLVYTVWFLILKLCELVNSTISILVGNLNSGLSNLITTVPFVIFIILASLAIFDANSDENQTKKKWHLHHDFRTVQLPMIQTDPVLTFGNTQYLQIKYQVSKMRGHGSQWFYI